jgi:uncharacterized protein (TIRG00374 family)
MVLGFIISLIFLILAFDGLDWTTFFQSLADVNIFLLPIALVIVLLGYRLQAWRERVILSPFADVPLKGLYDIQLIGAMGNNIYPFSGGEALRIYLLRNRYNVPIPTATTNMIIVRLVDGLTVLALILLSVVLEDIPAQQFVDITFFAAPIFLIVVAMFITITIRPEIIAKVGQFLRHVLPKTTHAPIIHIEGKLLESLNIFRDPQILFGVIGLTILTRMVEALAYWVVLIAFGLSSSYWVALLLVGVVSLGGIISASPGQIGVTHFAITLTLTTLGIAHDPALAYAIVVHMVIFMAVTITGGLLLLQNGLSFKHFKSAQITQKVVNKAQIKSIAKRHHLNRASRNKSTRHYYVPKVRPDSAEQQDILL